MFNIMSYSPFLKYFQAFLDFLRKLLTAYWGSLLVLAVGVCLPLLVFEQLAMVVRQEQGSFPWDAQILLAIHATANPQLDRFATIFTRFGVYWGVTPVACVLVLVLLYLRRWRSLAYLLTTLLGSIFINRTVKVLLHRVRPSLWVSLAPEIDYGFPSGHAMASTSMVVALVILTWGTKWSWPILMGGSLFVLGIGWTRIYLGVHFPSDVLAGWMISLAWAIGVSLLIRPHLTKPSLMSEAALTVKEEEAISS